MIISQALKYVFEDIKIPFENKDLSVNYHYGDQKELLLWTKDKGNDRKYPLIWYVLNKFTEFNDVYEVEARIVLMAHTKYEKLNNWRSVNTYQTILKPLTDEVKNTLLRNPYISVISKNTKDKFIIKDEPLFGDNSGRTEKTSNKESVSIDIVDARIITFKMRINANCIIK